MEPVSPTKTAPDGIGLLKNVRRFITQPANAVYGKSTPDKILDCGYIIIHLETPVHYATRATGVLTREIEIKATRDHVSHYYGRYFHRGGKAKLTIESPHRRLTHGEIEAGFQRFSVQLRDPLAKDQTEKIVTAVSWVDEI
jgi:hypothetical protein